MDPDRPRDTKLIGGNAPVLGALCIPTKFLRGSPWTQYKFAMFKLLSSGLLVAKNLVAFHPEGDTELQLFQGIKSAIAECNENVLEKLLEVNSRFEQEQIGTRPRSKLPSEIFLAALAHESEATVYLHHLFRAEVYLPSDCRDELEQWAREEEENLNPLAYWILSAAGDAYHRGPYTHEDADEVRAWLIGDEDEEVQV